MRNFGLLNTICDTNQPTSMIITVEISVVLALGDDGHLFSSGDEMNVRQKSGGAR